MRCLLTSARYRLVISPLILIMLASCSSGESGERSLDRTSAAVTVDVKPPTDEELSAILGRVRAQSAPADARGPRYAGSKGVKTIDDFMTKVMKELNAFWQAALDGSSVLYEAPAYHWFDGSVSTNCGPATSDMGAFYCPLRGAVTKRLVIYAPRDWMYGEIYTKFDDSADFAVASVLAHEMGHHLQRLIGLIQSTGDKCCGLLSINTELHADCLSGVWAHSAYGQGQLEQGDIEEALRAAADAQDPPGTDPRDPVAHGTAQQRTAFFRLGFDSGQGEQCDARALRLGSG